MSGSFSPMVADVSSFATVLADTGIINAEAQDEAQENVAPVLPAPVTARYLRNDLTDGAAASMDSGLLVAEQLWRKQRGTAYGVHEGQLMLDRWDHIAFTGPEFRVPTIIKTNSH
jgi:hypothetical protein